jgi:hypothetical protein
MLYSAIVPYDLILELKYQSCVFSCAALQNGKDRRTFHCLIELTLNTKDYSLILLRRITIWINCEN